MARRYSHDKNYVSIAIVISIFIAIAGFSILNDSFSLTGHAVNAPATNAVCGQTIVSNLVLDGDLSCATGDGLIAGANDIIIDCGGFLINGTNASSTAGIKVNGYTNVTVQNCYIKDFQNGVDYKTAHNGKVLNNTFESMISWGVLIGDDIGFTPVGSNNMQIIDNEMIGCAAGGVGVIISDNILVENNTMRNGGGGYAGFAVTNSFVRNNEIYSNTIGFGAGIIVALGSGNSFENNTIYSNTKGIVSGAARAPYNSPGATGDTGDIVANSTIYLNQVGIELGDSTQDWEIANNTFNNQGSDIAITTQLTCSSNNVIYNNLFSSTTSTQSNCSSNRWNMTKTLGTNIVGGPYLGGNKYGPQGMPEEGCLDSDADWLCDTVRFMMGTGENRDYHVLIQYPVCGDGIIEIGEQCDPGADNPNDCCNSTCQYESVSYTCRASAGQCDAAETCSGSSATCPADSPVTDGTACDDGSACIENDQCTSGVCGGTTPAEICSDLIDNDCDGNIDEGCGGGGGGGGSTITREVTGFEIDASNPNSTTLTNDELSGAMMSAGCSVPNSGTGGVVAVNSITGNAITGNAITISGTTYESTGTTTAGTCSLAFTGTYTMPPTFALNGGTFTLDLSGLNGVLGGGSGGAYTLGGGSGGAYTLGGGSGGAYTLGGGSGGAYQASTQISGFATASVPQETYHLMIKTDNGNWDEYAIPSSGKLSLSGKFETLKLALIKEFIGTSQECGNDLCEEGETVDNCSQDCGTGEQVTDGVQTTKQVSYINPVAAIAGGLIVLILLGYLFMMLSGKIHLRVPKMPSIKRKTAGQLAIEQIKKEKPTKRYFESAPRKPVKRRLIKRKRR